MSDTGGFSIYDLEIDGTDLDRNVLNENVLENVFDKNANNFDSSSNDFNNSNFGFNTDFAFTLNDKSLLYKEHDIRTQPYEGFDNIDTMENSKISSVEDTDNLSGLNGTDCCFDTQHEQVSGGKVVKTVKKKSKKKRKMTNVDIKEQPKEKKTKKAPFEVGSNIFKFEDCSVYKITNIYQDVGEHVWKADVEQVFPEVSDLSCTIVIDKDKYTQYNTII